MRVLNYGSGSEGNCTLISYLNTNILLDAGIDAEIISSKLARDKINKIDAILITHEHGDHIKYLGKLQKMLQCPVYIVKESYHNIRPPFCYHINTLSINYIEENYKYQINDIIFVPIHLVHDTKNNVGYLLKLGKRNMAYITDTGILPDQYLDLLKQMDFICLESNHDVEMLLESNRPYFLKQRILSEKGHLSNDQAAAILQKVLGPNTKAIALAHLSRECNTPEFAYDATIQVINDKNPKTNLYILSQYQETEIIIDD